MSTPDPDHPDRGKFLLRLAALLVGLFAVMAGIGLLITKVFENVEPIAGEDALNRSLASGRTPTGNSVTGFFSTLASTPVIIALLLVVMVVFRLVYGRWRESAFLFFAVGSQTLVFLATAAVLKRDRPDVEHLDSAPPTSSFPSGHTGAATALFVGIVLVLVWHSRSSWVRALLLVAVAVPLAVAYSRLYRGMHHPSDVVAAFVNGGLCVAIWARNVLFGVLPDRWAQALDGAGIGGRQRSGDLTAGARS